MPTTPAIRTRHRLEVRGIVQGVGFRPFVFRLANELALAGWVRNDAGGVTLEVEGAPTAVAMLARRLVDDAPVLARVDAVAVSQALPVEDAQAFRIVDSAGGRAATAIGADACVCPDCLAELFDRGDRRYRYAFVNCTHCGPRYTITRALPYDRSMTSMRAFAQCPACLAEYRNPRDRRFHAEPNACPLCGPRLRFEAADASLSAVRDPVAATVAALVAGAIVGIKGLGGFHLACDARNADAVATLRARKGREEKPFAVMAANAASLAPWVAITAAEATQLAARERPIVLLRKSLGADASFPGVAPGLAWLGAMLPYTPLHYLLFHEAAGRPDGMAWLDDVQPLVLVMTSANPGGEPLVTGNDEARMRLAGIADALLTHDREIVVRCDDSVMRAQDPGTFQFLRRGRGYTPRAIRLATPGPSVLATGGSFKNTICVTRGDEAFISQHIGDLDNGATCAAFEDTIAHLLAILDVRPEAVVHDLHPDFHASRHAAALAAEWGVPALAVQHHHAHVAAVLAEHGVDTPALGIALDGVGFGSDGEAWGGELLVVDGASFQRVGALAPLRLAGGDRAAREPWRMAAAALARAGRADEIARRFGDEPAAATVRQMLERGVRAPWTTSMGRWFDAAAALLGVQRRMSFEGQAAMLLEGLAEAHGTVPPFMEGFQIDADGALDLTPLVVHLLDIDDRAFGAALFHATLAEALATWIARAAARTARSSVACGGGCFLNAVLVRALRGALAARGVAMLQAGAVPPNDGGLALGQAWLGRALVATSRLH